MVDPGLLDCCMRRFNDDYREKLAGEVVAIDGKALCGASSDERTRPYIVSAWADAQGIVLGDAVGVTKGEHQCPPVFTSATILDHCPPL